MEVMFLHVTGSVIVYGSYVLPILTEVVIRIWSEVERFLFLCR